MKVLVIDNYDSFVYNLTHILRELDVAFDVLRNDDFSIGKVDRYDKLLFSPGPGLPEEAGLMMEVIHEYHHKKSMLGVCLGHQAIGQYFNGRLRKLEQPLHGHRDEITIHNSNPLFKNMENTIQVGHYHSWVVETDDSTLKNIAYDARGNVMALCHDSLPLYGVQFHPESIMTPTGKQIIKNWLSIVS